MLIGASGLQAQDCNPNPPQDMQEIAAYSIFQGNYTNGDYPFALRYGRWMLCSKPESIEGIPAGRFSLATQYNKFIRMYTDIGLSKSDPSEREAYLDTALVLFQDLLDNFEEVDKYETLQRRGRFYLENYNYIEGGLQLAYADFETMFGMDIEKTTTLADGYYIRVMVDNMSRNDARKDELIETIDQATPFANPDILSFFDETLNDAFSSPEERLEFCGAKLEEDPNSLSDLECVADAYEALNMQSELIETLKRIHELNPTFDSALKLEDVEQGNAEYAEAAELYAEALEKAPSDQDKKEINIDLSDVYVSLGDLPRAKRFIQDALAVDANYGLAYLKLASLYGQAVTTCTADRKLEAFDKVVYWVVIDYLNKAKQVDATQTNTVNSQLATYEAVTPSTEDKFFTLGYEQGQSVSVDASLNSCYSWIDETTTVR
jgi:tetratricopeptide (TPR) repeat protein